MKNGEWRIEKEGFCKMINEFVQANVWILLPFGAGVALGMVAMAIAVNMMREDVEEMDCERCEVVAMCRKMFGRYWNDKSAGGKGCRHPVKMENGECKMENEKRETGNGGKILHSQFSILHSQLAAGAMENPETESLKGSAARTGEYVPRAGEVEILEEPHAAPCGGNRSDAATSDASRKMPWNSTTRDAVGPGHGKPNFIQEELI